MAWLYLIEEDGGKWGMKASEKLKGLYLLMTQMGNMTW